MPVPQHVLDWLASILPGQYEDFRRTYNDVAHALLLYPSLAPRTDVHTFPNGVSALLLHLSGTLPISFRGVVYDFPVSLWIPHAYPKHPPLVYVTPTQTMLIRPGQHVDTQGQVYHPYLNHWASVWDKSTVVDLVAILVDIFAKEPPVISRPPGSAASQRVRPSNPQSLSQASLPAQQPVPSPTGSLEIPRLRTLDTSVDFPGQPPGPPPVPPKPVASMSTLSPAGHDAARIQSVTQPGPEFRPVTTEMQGLPSRGRYDVPLPLPAIPQLLPPTLDSRGPAISESTFSDSRSIRVDQQPNPTDRFIPLALSHATPPTNFGPPLPPYAAHPPATHQVLTAQTLSMRDSQSPLPQKLALPRERPPPPPDLLGESLPQRQSSTELDVPPPVPPSPEKAAALQKIGKTLYDIRLADKRQYEESLRGLQAQWTALVTAYDTLNAEMQSLDQLSALLLSNAKILRESLRKADEVIEKSRNLPVPNVDDLLAAPTVVANQLYALVSEERAIGETIFMLGRAMEKGRISPAVFAKTTRSLAREWYMSKALVRKIAHGMGLIIP